MLDSQHVARMVYVLYMTYCFFILHQDHVTLPGISSMIPGIRSLDRNSPRYHSPRTMWPPLPRLSLNEAQPRTRRCHWHQSNQWGWHTSHGPVVHICEWRPELVGADSHLPLE